MPNPLSSIEDRRIADEPDLAVSRLNPVHGWLSELYLDSDSCELVVYIREPHTVLRFLTI